MCWIRKSDSSISTVFFFSRKDQILIFYEDCIPRLRIEKKNDRISLLIISAFIAYDFFFRSLLIFLSGVCMSFSFTQKRHRFLSKTSTVYRTQDWTDSKPVLSKSCRTEQYFLVFRVNERLRGELSFFIVCIFYLYVLIYFVFRVIIFFKYLGINVAQSIQRITPNYITFTLFRLNFY